MCRTLVDTHEDGTVTEKLSDAEAAPFVEALQSFRHPYAEIAAPALAIYATPEVGEGAALMWRAACRDRFAAETPDGRIREIRHASHYLFLDHRDAVLAEMREFFSTLNEAG
jgi:pimeloyl-ACP methyl ester carboxylesterase